MAAGTWTGPLPSETRLLGAMWVLFVWSVLAQLFRLALFVLGVEDPERSRVVAGVVVAVVIALLAWGYAEAMRVPRIRRVDVGISRLGSGLHGFRVAVITDTHYGPIDRTRWSTSVVERVNELDADVVCHVGDIADGTVDAARRHRPDCSPRWGRDSPVCTSPVTTNTSARRKVGSTTSTASAGTHCITGTSSSNATGTS